MSALPPHPEIAALRLKWLAVDAVAREPVSRLNSLIRALLQGIAWPKRSFLKVSAPGAQQLQRFSGEFPTPGSREFLPASREVTAKIVEGRSLPRRGPLERLVCRHASLFEERINSGTR